MKDTIRIKPYLFRLDVHYVIEEQLNKKFANKVLSEHLPIQKEI